jgi:hypothetical protein
VEVICYDPTSRDRDRKDGKKKEGGTVSAKRALFVLVFLIVGTIL